MNERDNWQLFEAALTDELCQNIIENFSTLPVADGTTFNSDATWRNSKVRWVNGEQGLKSILMPYIHEANGNAFNVDISGLISEMQFTEYSEEYAGKYKLHHDINWQNARNFDRKLSMVVQLSDPSDYEGGLLSFSEVTNPVQKSLQKRGSIIIFPSYLQHAVSEVTKGTRYSLVCWVKGPRWR